MIFYIFHLTNRISYTSQDTFVVIQIKYILSKSSKTLKKVVGPFNHVKSTGYLLELFFFTVVKEKGPVV